jgi:integrase
MAAKRRRYEGRVYIGRDEHGKQKFWWVGRFATRRERDLAVARARTERPWETEPVRDEPTCDQWADRFLHRMGSGALRTRAGRRFKDSSIDTARSSLKAFHAEFGHRTPRSITRVEAEDWAARVPPSRIPIAITLMNDLYRAEEIDRNRFEGLSRHSDGRKDDRPPSEEEMLLLLDGCSALGDAYAPMMRAMLTFGAFTLMRPSELIELDWERDIDLDAGAIGRLRVQRRFYRGKTDVPKSNRERTITLVPPARAALDSLLEIDGYETYGLVFRNKTGGRLTAPTLTAYWKEVRARSRIDLDFYTCTKHYGVWYMKVVLALPDAAIAAQAGWSERSITKMVETYGHAVDERRLDEIDAAFAPEEIATNARTARQNESWVP